MNSSQNSKPLAVFEIGPCKLFARWEKLQLLFLSDLILCSMIKLSLCPVAWEIGRSFNLIVEIVSFLCNLPEISEFRTPANLYF